MMLTSIASFSQKDFTATNWVNDFGNLYTPEQEASLNSKIAKYEKETSIEIGIVTVDSLGNQSIEEYAYDQFNRLGIGKKGANNGLLIVFSLKDRASRVEVGKGMEPFFTDSDSYNSLQGLKPYFRAGKYFDGTDNCLGYIIKYLGQTPYTQKVAWLKEKQKKEAIEAEIARQEFLSGLRWTGSIASFIALLGWIYWFDKRSRKLKTAILESEKFVRNYSFPTDTYGSKIATGSLSIIEAYKSSLLLNVKPIKGENKESYLKRLDTYKSNLSNKALEHNRLINSIVDIKTQIRDIPNKLKSIETLNEKAKIYGDKIKAYGYASNYSPIEFASLSKIANEVKNETDVDKSISLYTKFKSNYDYVANSLTPTFKLLEKIELANSDVKVADNKITSYLSDIQNKKKWLKSGELERVQTKIKEFDKMKTASVDILTKAAGLYTVISLLVELASTLRRRKSDEEDEERREEERARARRSSSYGTTYGSSNYGSSNNDSGTTFGGFGGGSSGGGGASDGW